MTRSIVDEVRDIIAAAAPANSNRPELRLLHQAGVDTILKELEAIRLRGKTYERDRANMRLRFNPAPWVRHQMAIEAGRKG